MFDIEDASACFTEVEPYREAYPSHYIIKVTGYNARYTKPPHPLHPAPLRRVDPHGTRYQGNGSGPEPD